MGMNIIIILVVRCCVMFNNNFVFYLFRFFGVIMKVCILILLNDFRKREKGDIVFEDYCYV